MAIYRWQSNNTFESTSAQTNFIVIDKDQTSYETKTIKIGVDPVELKFCSAYRILLSVKGGNQGYSDDTSQEFYVCTIPDYSFTATRIKTGAITSIEVNCTVAGSSTYVYSSGNYDNVADLYVYWAKTEEAVKSATNTNFIELGTNVTARSYSHSFTASSLSGFKPSCYFAVKAVLKIDNNNKPGVYTTCEESWSEVKSFSLN